MTNTMESTRPAVVEAVQVQGVNVDGDSNTHDSTRLGHEPREQALLRGLLGAPAAHVLDIANGLCEQDIYAPHNLTVYRAIVSAAARLNDAGQPGAPVSPERVQLDLQQAGHLTNPNVAHALINATAGNYMPPAWPDVEALAAGLREARLRRACASAGAALVEAAEGGLDEIQRCLKHVAYLPVVARRAGLGVV